MIATLDDTRGTATILLVGGRNVSSDEVTTTYDTSWDRIYSCIEYEC